MKRIFIIVALALLAGCTSSAAVPAPTSVSATQALTQLAPVPTATPTPAPTPPAADKLCWARNGLWANGTCTFLATPRPTRYDGVGLVAFFGDSSSMDISDWLDVAAAYSDAEDAPAAEDNLDRAQAAVDAHLRWLVANPADNGCYSVMWTDYLAYLHTVTDYVSAQVLLVRHPTTARYKTGATNALSAMADAAVTARDDIAPARDACSLATPA